MLRLCLGLERRCICGGIKVEREMVGLLCIRGRGIVCIGVEGYWWSIYENITIHTTAH